MMRTIAVGGRQHRWKANSEKSSSPMSLLQLYESRTFPFGVCPGVGRMGEKEVPMLQVPTTRS